MVRYSVAKEDRLVSVLIRIYWIITKLYIAGREIMLDLSQRQELTTQLDKTTMILSAKCSQGVVKIEQQWKLDHQRFWDTGIAGFYHDYNVYASQPCPSWGTAPKTSLLWWYVKEAPRRMALTARVTNIIRKFCWWTLGKAATANFTQLICFAYPRSSQNSLWIRYDYRLNL